MSFFRRRLPKAFRVVGRDPADYAQEFQEFVDQSILIGEGLPAGFGDVDPIPVLVGGTADPGDPSDGWMAAKAQLVTATAPPTGLGNANAEGSSTSAPRADHVHKRDVRVKFNGGDLATRNALNFIATSGITDDAGNDEVDIDLTTAVGPVGDDATLLGWYFAQTM